MVAEGNTRRLPSWMAGTVAADEDKRSDDDGDNKNKKKRMVQKQSTESEEEEKPASVKAKTFSLANCVSKRRKFDQQDPDKEDMVIASKKRNSRRRRKAETKSMLEEEEEDEKKDEDLSVEDLVVIAEEYVKTKVYSKKKQLSIRESESAREISTTTSMNDDDLQGSLMADHNEQRLVAGECAESVDSTVCLTSGQSIVGASGTGNPVEDMLNLFLGPLLKKPLDEKMKVKEDKKIEFLANDLDFSNELTKQNHHGSGGEMILSMKKKKSNLKEKASMLFD